MLRIFRTKIIRRRTIFFRTMLIIISLNLIRCRRSIYLTIKCRKTISYFTMTSINISKTTTLTRTISFYFLCIMTKLRSYFNRSIKNFSSTLTTRTNSSSKFSFTINYNFTFNNYYNFNTKNFYQKRCQYTIYVYFVRRTGFKYNSSTKTASSSSPRTTINFYLVRRNYRLFKINSIISSISIKSTRYLCSIFWSRLVNKNILRITTYYKIFLRTNRYNCKIIRSSSSITNYEKVMSRLYSTNRAKISRNTITSSKSCTLYLLKKRSLTRARSSKSTTTRTSTNIGNKMKKRCTWNMTTSITKSSYTTINRSLMNKTIKTTKTRYQQLTKEQEYLKLNITFWRTTSTDSKRLTRARSNKIFSNISTTRLNLLGRCKITFFSSISNFT